MHISLYLRLFALLTIAFVTGAFKDSAEMSAVCQFNISKPHVDGWVLCEQVNIYMIGMNIDALIEVTCARLY